METNCEWAISNKISNPGCHKDFCECMKLRQKDLKQKRSEYRLKLYNSFLRKLRELNIPHTQNFRNRQILAKEKVYINPFQKSIRFKGKTEVYRFGTIDKLLSFLVENK